MRYLPTSVRYAHTLLESSFPYSALQSHGADAVGQSRRTTADVAVEVVSDDESPGMNFPAMVSERYASTLSKSHAIGADKANVYPRCIIFPFL